MTTQTTRPGEIKAVISGWRKAMAFIKTNPDTAYSLMSKAFNLPVTEFKDTVSGIRWLDFDDNRRLFGTKEAPGSLAQS